MLLSHLSAKSCSLRPTYPGRSGVVYALALAMTSLVCRPALAVDGVWAPTGFTGDGTGSWSDATKWSGGTIASGAGSQANFSTLNITVDSTVSLNSPRTIGRLLFGDTTASNNWILDNAGNPANVLTLDNTGGTGGPRITVNNQTATISAILAGTNGVTLTGGVLGTSSGNLTLSGANTYSGVTTINAAAGPGGQQFTLLLQNDSALGTSSVFFDPGGQGARLTLGAGVNIPNAITLNTVRSIAGNAAIRTDGDVTATYSGAITKNGVSTSGGEFGGPVGAATTNFLILTGPIVNNRVSVAKNDPLVSNNAIQVRHGNVRMADTTGTSSTFRIENRNAILQVGANNGIATNAYVEIGGNVGNPGGPPAAVLDLNGFNQRLVGVSNYLGNTQQENITNSSTTSPAVLTLAPVDPTANPHQARLVFTAGGNAIGGNAFISDTDENFPLSLVINGHAAGIQYLTTPNGSYRGVTTLTSGTLAVSALDNAGTNSSIGASTFANPASALVFDGGTLRYVNTALNNANNNVALANSTTPSTDRNYTINTGKSGTIDVEAAGTTLTWSGASANTSGSLMKAGAGRLVLAGANAHTGGTTVGAGALSVTGSLSTGAVAVAGGATLTGNGTIGGVVNLASGASLVPGDGGVGNLSVGGLTLNAGSSTNFEFDGVSNDTVTVSNAGGLNIGGGNVNLFNVGGITPFSTNGTYTLMNINGGFSGATSNFTIANAVAGKFYNVASTASAIQLIIGNATTVNWNGNASGSWSLGGNWAGGASPNAIGTSVRFNGGNLTGASATTVAVDGGGKIASGIIFNDDMSGTSFDIAGPGTLTLNNGVAAAGINVVSGSQTISAPVAVTNAMAVSLSNSSSLTNTGGITGGRPLTVSGTGSVTLRANNTYSTTSISAATPDAATLNVGAFGGSDTAGSLGSGDVAMTGGAVLNFNRANAYAFAGGITGNGVGAGSVNQLGSGTTTVAGAINNVTTVNVSAGALTASSTINQTGGVNVTGTGSLTAAGSVSGAGAVTVNTTGTVNLNASNSFTGGLSIGATGGTVNLNAAGALPANAALGVDGGTLNLNANSISVTSFLDTVAGGVIVNNGAAASTSTITFSGAGAGDEIFAALNNGAGGGKIALVTGIANSQSGNIYVLNLQATGTYSGGTTVNSQSIQASADNAFGTGPILIKKNNISTNSSQILLAPGVSIGNAITIEQGNPLPVNGVGAFGVIQQTAAGGDTDVLGVITIQENNLNGGLFNGAPLLGADWMNVRGAVNVSGTADTVVQRSGQVRFFAGGNYPRISLNGITQLGANNGINPTALIEMAVLEAGTLELSNAAGNSFNQAASGLSATGANVSIVQNTGIGASVLTLNTTASNTYNGSIDGNVSLSVAGTGTQILTGTSSYTGATTINGGTLLVNNAAGAGTGSGAVVVNSGGTLGGTGFIDNSFGASSVTVNAGGNLAPGASAGTLTMSLGTGSLNLSGVAAGGLKFELGTPEVAGVDDNLDSDHVLLTSGTLNIGTLNFSEFTFSNAGGLAAGTYTLFDASSPITGAIGTASGSFSGFTGTLSINGANNDILLTVTPGGNSADFNNDLIVNGTDFLIWQRGLGLTGQTGKTNGDANGDTVVNGADLGIWKTQFGTPGATGAASAVPEPTACMLLVVGGLGIIAVRRNGVRRCGARG
jgi:fibronectin-binding autotransporter adhesin